MWYERPWHGDVVATPACGRSDHEDGDFEGFGGRSWDQADSRANRSDPGSAAVKERVRHLEPVRTVRLGHWALTQDRVGAERAEVEQTDLPPDPHGAARSLRSLPGYGQEYVSTGRSTVSKRLGG